MHATPTLPHQTNPHTLHPIIKNIFHSRNIPPPEIPAFLSWKLQDLPPLCCLLDLDKAAKRILRAIAQGQTIAIYGDYDVDGTTSCALSYHFFQTLGTTVKLYQPNRFTEGYGLHISSIDRALADQVTLLITVDCGITNESAITYAQKSGIDIIVTDHHKDGLPQMPPAFAIVNPHRRDETCPPQLKTLAGVGVAFALYVRIRELVIESGQNCPSLYPLLPLVAIGTLCDMVPLSPMNLKLIRHGLHAAKTSNLEGIKKLFPPSQRTREIIDGEHLTFFVGPLINSKGRLEHPQKALELLLTNDPDTAFQTFNHLKQCNQQRKTIQAQIFDEAQQQIRESMDGQDTLINIAYAPHWHEGVIGIVATKLVETFKVPAIVLCDSTQPGIIKGSARSAGHFNIYQGLCQCSELLVKFGGHQAAAGLSMPKQHLNQLKKQLQQHLGEIPAITRTQQERFDLTISIDDISPQLALGLEHLGPFGVGHPRPIFHMDDAILDSVQMLKDVHVRWTFRSPRQSKTFQGISFFFVKKWDAPTPQQLQEKCGKNITVRFSLGFNHFRGNKFLQLHVHSIAS